MSSIPGFPPSFSIPIVPLSSLDRHSHFTINYTETLFAANIAAGIASMEYER